jgi:hypothetical protein
MRHLAVSMIILALCASGAAARSASNPKIVIHGDVAIPVTPDKFADGFSLGLGGGLGLAFPVSSRLMLLVDLEYIVFGIDEEGFKKAFGLPPTASLTGEQIATFYASLAAKFDLLSSPSGMVRPYVLGGFGFFRYNPESISGDGSSLGFEDQNTLGVHGGGGVEIVLAPYLALFLDAMYVLGFTDNEATGYAPIRAGVAFDWKSGQ